ncbi:hypothetical protein HBN50_07860 [Halobacteriovorax sp. GB3]|uniref:hypothetical protein n=1 Tax=Halobacteriovorax sp. GB3 TaxID=2719615 RepID=UPI00236310CD|nr:hypothetical protein [Halobacteriovorax sp. GB3]MDD0853007.1 hypothetical protein [Halobacteriovorax sp. GB3]
MLTKEKTQSLKDYIFIATTAIGVVLYMHRTFATQEALNQARLLIKQQDVQIKFQNKVQCLIARRLEVEESKLDKICDFTLDR